MDSRLNQLVVLCGAGSLVRWCVVLVQCNKIQECFGKDCEPDHPKWITLSYFVENKCINVEFMTKQMHFHYVSTSLSLTHLITDNDLITDNVLFTALCHQQSTKIPLIFDTDNSKTICLH